MIVSMNPPYDITIKILRLVASVSEKIGEINAAYLDRPAPRLRKQNRIRTIQSTLSIEGNSLTEGQITAIIENKRVTGREKDIREVLNAIKVYDSLGEFAPFSSASFLKAHKMMMQGLVESPGKYRSSNVGIVQGSRVTHIAPPHANVPGLMKDLFDYLKEKSIPTLIKSCVFHYETEFIHPFTDGNGRMGRLWQTLLLADEYPLFRYLPFETLISKNQEEYYKVLGECDNKGNSTLFIEYMLNIIDQSLNEVVKERNRGLLQEDRLEYFRTSGRYEFTRQDYMSVFKDISTATASRDLKKGVEMMLFDKTGDKNSTSYKLRC
jgi:Fic family protein